MFDKEVLHFKLKLNVKAKAKAKVKAKEKTPMHRVIRLVPVIWR